MHADTMSLDDRCLSITIDDKTGQIVTLTMNEPISVVMGIVGYANPDAHVQGRQYALFPKIIIYRNIFKSKHSNRDGAFLIMPHSNKITIGIQHSDDITFFYAFIHPLYGTRKDPGMKSLQRLILAPLKINIPIHYIID